MAWSAGYFFCLLCGYYVLRPVRDEMGIQGGVENLPWMFTGTFLAMLAAVPVFGAAVARLPRRRLLPAVYLFFIVNITLFYGLFQLGPWRATIAQAFFIWVSVFNLFAVSVFWSFMADLYSNGQASRLFPIIAAGGSAGAIVGPGLTAVLATWMGPVNLLPVSALWLAGALCCIWRLGRMTFHSAATRSPGPDHAPGGGQDAETGTGGGVLEGMSRVARSPYLTGICLFILLYTSLSTFLYLGQAHIIEANLTDPGRRTALFALMDLTVNVLTLAVQVTIAAHLIERFGLPAMLALVPAALTLGFAALGMAPVLTVLIAVQVLRRAGNYALTRPSREMLFTVLPRTDKYKSKNFIDTVVYRGGDALSAWLFAALGALGMGLSMTAFTAVPLALVWTAVAWFLGRRREARARPETREVTS